MKHAEKLSITLTPQMAKLVRDSVASGRFASASEVIRDAMRAWQQKEQEHEETIASIRARVQASLDDPRPLQTGEQVEAYLDQLDAETEAA
jgi:antitoxin ParD1/3/4